MKKLTAIDLLLALAGCANVRFQWAASQATDNVLADLERAKSDSTK